MAMTLVSCNDSPQTDTPDPGTSDQSDGNVLLAEWTGPYGGLPPFDKMNIADLKPAMSTAIEKNLQGIEAIAEQSEPATFDNTILALERNGSELGRVSTVFGVWIANLSTPEVREAQGEIMAMLADMQSKITQNKKLFQRIQTVYESDELKARSADEQRLVKLVYEGFAHNGATLEGEAKERYAEINKELADLHTQFSNNVLADEEGYVLYLDESQLGGLPESLVSAAASAAKDRGEEGKYAILNTRSSMDPFLTYSTQRDLREKVWRTYYSRGDNGDEHDNNALIAQILQLRNERVGLLGYENYAQWRLTDRMAKTPEKALGLMEAVWPAAVARVREEVADMQAIADQDQACRCRA